MKQLFLFLRGKGKRLACVAMAVCFVIAGILVGNMQSILAAVSGDDLSKDVSSATGISQYDFEKGRTSKDNQGIDKEYSLRFFKESQTPVTTGKLTNFTDDDEKHYGNGKAFFTKDNEKGKITALYKNLAEYTVYDGNKVKEVIPLDYKITVTDWEENDASGNHYITFGNTAGVGIRNMNWIRVTSEFLKAGTNTKVSIKGLVTITDIDDCQFVGILKSQVEKIYLNKKDTNLSYGMPTIKDTFFTLYNKIPGNGASEDKYRNMFAFTMTGSSYDEIFGSTESPSGVDWFFITDNKYVFTEITPEAPVKSIYDDDEKNVTTNHVSSRAESWTYHVDQEIPREDLSQNYWKEFQFDDEVESCLNIEDIKVLNQDEDDVSSKFTITKTGQHITAKAKDVSAKSFYGNTYSLQVQVCVKKEAEENFETHGHYNGTKTELQFKNIASAKIVAGDDTVEKKTNEVKTIVELPETTEGNPGLNIKKTVDHYEWQAKDEVSYKVEVSHSNRDAVATDVIVKDTDLPEGLELDESKVKVTGVERYDFKAIEGGWTLETERLPYGDTITIEFVAKVDKALNGTKITNTATAKAYGVPETSGQAKIYVNSPKLNVKKTTEKKEYKVGEFIKYQLDVTQENEGCFMRNVVIDDKISTEGVELRKESIVVSDQKGKDITKECEITCDKDSFHIETKKNLVKGKNPYNYEEETKLSVSYEAEILDGKLSGFDVENVATTPATENTNGELIRDDDEIPSGGDEDSAKVFVEGAKLSILKDSDQTKYEYGSFAKYTVLVKQTEDKSIAKNIVISDKIQEAGCSLLLDSIKVYYNDEDITKSCDIDADDSSYEIKTNKDLPYEDEIKVTYQVKMPKEDVNKIHNIATTLADNAKKAEAKHLVTLAKKVSKVTSTHKKSSNNPQTSDKAMYRVFIIAGMIAFLFGLFLVLKKIIRYNK